MPAISVLMSVYNEPESQIRESIESILAQSFKDFEVILVSDNPSRNDVLPILDSYCDKRIIFYQNPKNIGLAMTMNKAAELASANLYARMDADDIAEKDRLEKQIECFKHNQYDLVFSRYVYIDENSQLIVDKEDQELHNSDDLSYKIAFRPSIIHHPTAMFTREIFEKVGGYRDFPCSQDADLWLRMQESGCRFFMLPDFLLRYRISRNSVTYKRWFQQQLTIHYIMQLSLERLKYGEDSYSEHNYNDYLKEKHVSDENKANGLHKSEELLSKALHERRNGHKVKAIILRCYVFITSKILREYYICVMKKKRIMRNSSEQKNVL